MRHGHAPSDTVGRVRRIFCEELGADSPAPGVDVIETGLLDSLGFVTLLVEIEREFSITLPMERIDIATLRTVEGIAELIDGVAVR